MRELFREYQVWLDVDLCFQSFEAELAGLPGRYAPPRGALWLAWAGEAVAGVVALRPLDETACEMKRLYVRPAWRGRGLGRRLAEETITTARGLGYQRMLLDTLPKLTTATALYRQLGFRDTTPYYHNPEPGVVYLELDLVGHE